MNPIPTEFKEGAFNHRCVYTYRPNLKPNSLPIAIYEKTESGKPRGFEVVRFQLRKAESVTVKGKSYSYPDRIVYPENEQWGTHGFSCLTIQDAHKHLQTMIGEPSQVSLTLDNGQTGQPD